MYISLQREKDHAGLERTTQQGRHSADIRRVQKRLMISGPLGAGERIDRGILTNKLLLSRKACVRLCVCITVCADKICFKITTGHFRFVKTFFQNFHNFEWLFEEVQCWLGSRRFWSWVGVRHLVVMVIGSGFGNTSRPLDISCVWNHSVVHSLLPMPCIWCNELYWE